MRKEQLHVVSFSGGKDSTAMLLRMIELGMPIDIILFCDTGLEFPALYEHIQKVERYIDRKVTVIRADETFEYLFGEKEVNRRADSSVTQRYGNRPGYGWAGPRQRWCTEKLKNSPRNKFLRQLRKEYEVIEYVGIAADEKYRLVRKNNQRENCRHPLVEWGMTEADCLNYCYERGFDWGGLYNHFSRVSCWCCPLQSLQDCRQLYLHFPNLWSQLREWDNSTWRDFKAGWSVEKLEKRFDFEEQWQKTGKPLKGKAFYSALKEYLGGIDDA